VKLLVTRPLPGGEATAQRLRRLGHDVVLMPLLATEAVAWQPPPDPPSAVMLTSAAAARLAEASAYHTLPLFAVGAATAAAATGAGFRDVRNAGGTAQALLDHVAASGAGDILHLAGEDRTPMTIPDGLRVTTRIVYRARRVPLAGWQAVDWVLLYSQRTAAHLAAEVDRLGLARDTIALAAISAAAARAAGPGWRAIATARRPDEDALLAAIGISCQ
jgi:uroporphyrinogen-III synthase